MVTNFQTIRASIDKLKKLKSGRSPMIRPSQKEMSDNSSITTS
jgi:hypothetical protein